MGGLVFRHEPLADAEPGEIAGHLHPCASVAKWGRSVRRRCFVADGARLVLPSFGAYTGGLDVGDAAIAALFGGALPRLHAGRTSGSMPSRRAVCLRLGGGTARDDSQPMISAISTAARP